MVVKLSIGASRGVLLLSLAVFCVLAYFSIRNARAQHAIGLNTRAGYERAVRLEPGDARNWYLLGRSYQYDFERRDCTLWMKRSSKSSRRSTRCGE